MVSDWDLILLSLLLVVLLWIIVIASHYLTCRRLGYWFTFDLKLRNPFLPPFAWISDHCLLICACLSLASCWSTCSLWLRELAMGTASSDLQPAWPSLLSYFHKKRCNSVLNLVAWARIQSTITILNVCPLLFSTFLLVEVN